MGKSGQKVEHSSYEVSQSWGCDVQHGDHSKYCVVCLAVAKRVYPTSFHHSQKSR